METKPNSKKKSTQPSDDVKREMDDCLRRERCKLERQRMEELLEYKKDFVEFRTDDPIERAKYAHFNNKHVVYTANSDDTDSQEETTYIIDTNRKTDDHYKMFMSNYNTSATSTKTSQEDAFCDKKQEYKCACISPRSKNFCDKYCYTDKKDDNSKQSPLQRCLAQYKIEGISPDSEQKFVEQLYAREKVCAEKDIKKTETVELELDVLNKLGFISEDSPYPSKENILKSPKIAYREHDIYDLGLTNKMNSKKVYSRFVPTEFADNRKHTRDTQRDATSRQQIYDKLSMGTTSKLDSRKIIPYELNSSRRNLPYMKPFDAVEIENELSNARSSACSENTKCDTRTESSNGTDNGDENNFQLIPIYLQKRIVHTDDELSLSSSSNHVQNISTNNEDSRTKNNGINTQTSGALKNNKHPIYGKPKYQHDV